MSNDYADKESYADSEEFCPLCMELFDLDDKGFLPCPCGYRICRFCWHRIKNYDDNVEAAFEETENTGKCPACRQVYSDVPAGFNSNLTIEAMLEQNKSKKKKKRLQNKQKQKQQEEKQKLREILKRDEKSLSEIRVVQKNLVFVVGIPQRTHEELRREFSKFGKICKLVIGNANNSNLITVYVTYFRPEDAIKTIKALNSSCTNNQSSQFILNFQSKLGKGSTNTRSSAGLIKASLGTTKYCNHWLKNQQCPKLPDCMYLHELAEQEASFTKEDMQKGKHSEYEKKLIQQYSTTNKNSLDNIDLVNLKNNSKNEDNNSNSSLNNFNTEDDLEVNNDEDENGQSCHQNNTKNNLKDSNNEDNYIEGDLCNKLSNKKNKNNKNINNVNSIQSDKNSINKNARLNDNFIHSSSQDLIVMDDLLEGSGSFSISNNSPKSNCINIENSNNIKSRFNLLDEIIANSSDSSTSYSTCSSGSNRITNDLNEITTIEGFSTLKLLESKLTSPHTSNKNNDINNVKHQDEHEDDGLDFDPISISTTGLQDLLKSGTMIENNLSVNHPLNQLIAKQNQNLHNQTILTSTSSNLPTNTNISSHDLHNQSQIKNNERLNVYNNTTLNSSFSSTVPTNDLADNWKNSLRALLPNVNITFSNCSSSNQNNVYLKQQQQHQFSQIKSPLNFSQQNSIQNQKINSTTFSHNNLNFQQFNQQTIKTQSNLFNQQQQQQKQKQQQQQPQQSQQPQQQKSQQLHSHLHQQQIYPLTLLQHHQQQFLRQQRGSSGLNFQYTNYFLPQQQSKQSILQQQQSPQHPQPPQSQQNIQAQIQQSPHLNLNLQRFFTQGFHQDSHAQQPPPPPGFTNF